MRGSRAIKQTDCQTLSNDFFAESYISNILLIVFITNIMKGCVEYE